MRHIGAWGDNHSLNYGGEQRDGEKWIDSRNV